MVRCPLKVLAYDLCPQGVQGKEHELRLSHDPDGTPHRQYMCGDYLSKTEEESKKKCVWWNCGKKTCGIAA